jgi:energy-coupling factor transporter ATP-binding protein EcfA2
MEQNNPLVDWEQYAQMTKGERSHAFMRTIAHPHFVATSKALQNVIQEASGGSLVFVCGPAGVGKTTLKNHALQWDMGQTPILSLLARPPLHRSFSWKGFLQSGISALEQPLVGREDTSNGDDDGENTELVRAGESRPGSRRLTKISDDDLRISLETAMKRHRPAAVIIDDAHHLGRVSGSRQLQNQLDCLKSMAEATETVHVLIGSYELFNLYDVCIQSTARSFFVHFPRYGSTDEELSQFKNVLRTFQQFLPFEEEADLLLKHWEFCYERSLGCVGILHFMLARAVYAALRADERKLGRAYLERYALSEAECHVMMRQIYGAERDLACRSAPTELRKLLGLAPHIAFGAEISGNFSEKGA